MTNLGRMTWTAFTLKAAAAACAVLALGYGFQSRYRIGIDPQKTRCLDARILLVDLKDKSLIKGNLYVIEQSDSSQSVTKRLVKRLAAGEGDRLQIDETGALWINGEKIRDTLPLLKFYQKPVSEYEVNRVLGKDEWFFLGDREPSNDSRYWGCAKTSQIQGRAWILF